MSRAYELCRQWDHGTGRVGDIVVLAFLAVQGLDGALTYLGLHIWGPGLEANPLVSSAISFAGIGFGVAGAKLIAAWLGIVLHLRQVHSAVAMLTLVYVTAAILPWTAMFLVVGR